jgi:hypothetical protein
MSNARGSWGRVRTGRRGGVRWSQGCGEWVAEKRSVNPHKIRHFPMLMASLGDKTPLSACVSESGGARERQDFGQ